MNGSDLGQLLDIIMPSQEGLVAVLQAYFDESEQNGIFALAGFVFRKDAVLPFTEEWSVLYAPYGFAHMTDMHARAEQFEGIDADEAKRLCESSVAIINRYVAFGVAIGCRVEEVNACLPKWVSGRRVIGFGSHYPFCCQLAMVALGGFLEARGIGERVAYVFEAGNEYEGEAHAFFGNMPPSVRRSHHHYSHAFVPKADAVPLQAADMLAWEYARYWNLTAYQREIPMRRSLAAILTSGLRTLKVLERFHINFFTGPPLWSAAERMRWIIEEQIEDEKSSSGESS